MCMSRETRSQGPTSTRDRRELRKLINSHCTELRESSQPIAKIAVYFILSIDGALRYIGSSDNVSARLRQQRQRFTLARHRFYWMTVDRDQRLEIESTLIRRFAPDENSQMTSHTGSDAKILRSLGLSMSSLNRLSQAGRLLELGERVPQAEWTIKKFSDGAIAIDREPREHPNEPEDLKILARAYGAHERERA
jgi:hypothetical protein